MADKKKELRDFLSGKESEEGKKAFEAWYNSAGDADQPGLKASDETLQKELARIKGKSITVLEHRERNPFVYWKVAATALLIISAGIALYLKRDSLLREQITFVEQVAPKGKVVHLSLSDGSQVWLNADTKFRYPQKFGSRTREVYLEGEAFFEVSKDASKPFRIHSGSLTTTVLGTSFNVKAYGTDELQEVAVVTGKVSVVHEDDRQQSSEVLLQPGQKAVLAINKGKLWKEDFSDLEAYTSWKDGKLIFEDIPVDEVISSLGRFYNIDIQLGSEALRSCRVTATFDPMPLEKVMYLLCFTLNAEYTHTGNSYFITGTGCDPH